MKKSYLFCLEAAKMLTLSCHALCLDCACRWCRKYSCFAAWPTRRYYYFLRIALQVGCTHSKLSSDYAWNSKPSCCLWYQTFRCQKWCVVLELNRQEVAQNNSSWLMNKFLPLKMAKISLLSLTNIIISNADNLHQRLILPADGADTSWWCTHIKVIWWTHGVIGTRWICDVSP